MPLTNLTERRSGSRTSFRRPNVVQVLERRSDVRTPFRFLNVVLILNAVLFYAITAQANTYTTSFPATENPISQGGLWANGGQSPAVDWTNCRTTPGLAFGTENVNSGTDDDSTCVLAGTWGPNQTVTGVVHAVGNHSAGLEVELRLRVTMASHSITGYEIDFTPGHLAIVKWLGPINQFSVLKQINFSAADGDTLSATISGTSPAVITVFRNGTQILQATDSSPFTSGAPGMGFFDRGDSTASDMGFTSFTATDGSSSGDTTPPSVPTGLTATAASSSQINLSWTASTDNVGVAGYGVYRNSVWISSVTSGTTFQDTGRTASTMYTYNVTAYDAAGNVSDKIRFRQRNHEFEHDRRCDAQAMCSWTWKEAPSVQRSRRR